MAGLNLIVTRGDGVPLPDQKQAVRDSLHDQCKPTGKPRKPAPVGLFIGTRQEEGKMPTGESLMLNGMPPHGRKFNVYSEYQLDEYASAMLAEAAQQAPQADTEALMELAYAMSRADVCCVLTAETKAYHENYRIREAAREDLRAALSGRGKA